MMQELVENNVKPSQVLGSVAGHFTIIGDDEAVWSIGYRINGKHQSEKEKLCKVNKPDDCIDYQKVSVGKFHRVILTKAGKLFFNGENKKSCSGRNYGLQQNEEFVNNFVDVTSYFPIDAGDKIVDVAAGYHQTLIATEKGKLYAAGTKLRQHCNRTIPETDR